MKIITPIAMTDAKLADSNVTEDDYSEWSDATTYARGDYCISTTTHTVYRSLEDSNLDNDPDAEQVALADPLVEDPDPVNWQVISATNRWKAFDQKPSVQTTNSETVEFEIAPDAFVGGVAGFNLSATEVSIVGETVSEGEIYSATVDLYDGNDPTDWYAYYFDEFIPVAEFALTDLPPYEDAVWTITVTNTGGTAGVGQIVLGPITDIGTVVTPGTGLTGLDFSYVANDDFGNLTRVVREATRLADFEVVAESSKVFALFDKLRRLRGGAPAVWVGDTRASYGATIYGFARDYRLIYESRAVSTVSLQIQGMI